MANGDDRRTTLSTDLQDYIDRGQLNLIVSGNSEVYVGDKQVYTGGQYEMFPQYEDRYKAAQEGFKAITQDQNLYGQMSQAYNIFNNKPINAKVAPDDLERFYTDATLEASRRDPADKVSALDVIFGRLPSAEVIQGLQDETGGPRGRGAYTGPRETITMASERDLRTAVDAMAAQVLGRAATEDEFKKALEQVRTAEQAEPTITTTGVGRTVTQSGLTAEGRSDIIREALMQGPEAEDFGKATKMMDLFYSALEARPEGA